jgi:hypothetical protein
MSGYRISFKRWRNPRHVPLDDYNVWEYVDASPTEVFETRKEAQERIRETHRGKDSEGVDAIFRVVKARSNAGMAKKRKLKFGSPAWRKKYAAKAKRNRAAASKTNSAKRKRRTGANTYTRSGAAAKRKRLKQMIRQNPPRKWMKVKAVRVKRVRGRDVLEIRK